LLSTDLEPLNLLEFIVPTFYSLGSTGKPSQRGGFAVEAKKFLKFCDYFPEEFSVLLVIRIPPAISDDHCLLTLTSRTSKKSKFSVILTSTRLLRVTFTDADEIHTAEFAKVEEVLGEQWHSLVVNLAGQSVSLRVDCGSVSVQHLQRRFPAFINARNDDILVGSCNHDTNDKFSVCTFRSREWIFPRDRCAYV
jgi:hypothetical protein